MPTAEVAWCGGALSGVGWWGAGSTARGTCSGLLGAPSAGSKALHDELFQLIAALILLAGVEWGAVGDEGGRGGEPAAAAVGSRLARRATGQREVGVGGGGGEAGGEEEAGEGAGLLAAPLLGALAGEPGGGEEGLSGGSGGGRRPRLLPETREALLFSQRACRSRPCDKAVSEEPANVPWTCRSGGG